MNNRESITKGSAPAEEWEERLRALFAAADPPVKPSEALRQRVAAITAPEALPSASPVGTAKRQGHRGGRRGALLRIGLGLAGAAAVALATISLAPTLVAARALRRVQAAISDARSMHEVAWHLNPDGSRVKTYEIWYQGGRWRDETRAHGQVQIFGAGRLWTYDPQLHQVTVRRAASPDAHTPSGFSMAAISRDSARWHETIRMLNDRVIAGRRVHQFTLTQPRDPAHARVLLVVDAATDLPIQIESQLEMNGRWTTQRLGELRYNDPLPAALFEPRFPRSALVIDLDHGRRQWQQRLAKSIARKHVGDRTVVVRDLQVNAEGDVFLLYTAGALPGDVWPDWSVDLTDDLGTRYLASEGFQPYVRVGNGPGGEGFLFGGRKLEGAWWIPVLPHRPWKARRFTVTFHVQPAIHHGPNPVPNENFSASTSFTLRVRRPGSALLPLYMPYMGEKLDRWDLRRWEAIARAGYYRRSGSSRNLGKALACYQEVNRLREEQAQELGEPVRDPQLWFDTGEVLRELGRKAEARAAFEEAAREEIYPNGVRQRAEAALKALR